MDLLENPWISKFIVELTVSLVLVAGGYLVGSYRERKSLKGRGLDEYDFYPYESTPENFAEFSLKDFRLGIHYFLRNTDARAARQLIFIGEQNDVRGQLDATERAAYEKLHAKYDGTPSIQAAAAACCNGRARLDFESDTYNYMRL